MKDPVCGMPVDKQTAAAGAMHRWVWLCPILVVLLSVATFFYWGWSWITIGLIALVMVCPAALVWGSFQIRKLHDTNLISDPKQSTVKR